MIALPLPFVNTPTATIPGRLRLIRRGRPEPRPTPDGWRIVAEGCTIRNATDGDSPLDRAVARATADAPKPLPGQLALPLGHDPARPTALRPVVGSIPPELAIIPNWLVWRYEWREGSAGQPGKWTKVPHRGDGTGLAKSTDPADWGRLAVAAETYAAGRGRFDGIGFVVTSDLGFIGVDLDHCLGPDGSLAEWAAEIVARLASYTERTPGGDGLRVWVRGTLPAGWRKRTGRGTDGRGAIEVYESGRYFTVTGLRWDGASIEIGERASALASIHAELAPVVAPVVVLPVVAGSRSDRAEIPDDTILGKIRGSRNGEKFSKLWSGDASDHAGDHSAADLALCGSLAFWVGPDPDRIDTLFRRSGLMRPKWDTRHGAQTYGAMTVSKALAGRTEFYDWTRAETPTITIGTDERRVNDEAISALARDPDIYQRAGMLTTIRRVDSAVSRGLRRAVGSPTIATVGLSTLRERLASNARWERVNADGEVKAAHPPEWSVSAVAARGHWPGIRHLGAIVEAPTLRHDGTILDRPGYDPGTGLFLAPSVVVPALAEAPTQADARRAAAELGAVVAEFPFAGQEHKATWLAALLTPLARFAVDGSVPFFMVDATTPGSGKTLLADVIALVATGRHASKIDYPDDDAEMRKSLLAIALEGDGIVLWDNIAAPFGGSALDGAITAGTIRGRILGRSEMTPALPIVATMLGTGNNVSYRGDFLRRVVPIRLEPDMENPEARSGFAHPDLLGYVESERGRLVASALTILRAYAVAGSPAQGLTPFGSFEAWSRVVRSAVHWATGHDPCATRAGLTAHDPDAQARAGLILGLAELCEVEGKALTAAEILKIVGDATARYSTLREALEALGRHGEMPSVRTLGNRLPKLRGRVVEGKRLESVALRAGATAWRVATVGSGSSWLGGHSEHENTCDSGDSFSNPSRVNSSICILGASKESPSVGEILPAVDGNGVTRVTRVTTSETSATPDPWAGLLTATQTPQVSPVSRTARTPQVTPSWDELAEPEAEAAQSPPSGGRVLTEREIVEGLGFDYSKGVPSPQRVRYGFGP